MLARDAVPSPWPLELWVASVWASHRLLRAGRRDLAALMALLPLAALLAAKILGAP